MRATAFYSGGSGWAQVPTGCSAQVAGDDTIHFSTNMETDNERFKSGEFVKICEKCV